MNNSVVFIDKGLGIAMNIKYEKILRAKMNEESYSKLLALKNKNLYDFAGKFVELCNPESLYMCDDSSNDAEYVKQMALKKGEEKQLANPRQTVHYDNYNDQARDKANTKFLVKHEDMERMKSLNSIEFTEGTEEITTIATDIMKGKDAVLKLFVEGPSQSVFARPCAQITDSWYVCHSEQILYRNGYEHFKNMDGKDDFYRFVHSSGKLDPQNCSVNLDKRRIYMDIYNKIVYSVNNQYAGNSLGLKKHAMRLAIKESQEQGWLCEHMFIMACINNEKNRKTYFAGAYPSACGKTSTSMIPGEKIVGDDIAYFRNIDGILKAANVEQGVFGIIKDVNEKDDPLIFKNLRKNQETIFSNVLIGPDNNPYWVGCKEDIPHKGENHSGPNWYHGKKDNNGVYIEPSHSNARYTMRLDYLENIDEDFYSKDGVHISGIIYGGRDSYTCVPCEESFSWVDGIIIKAATLESETTSATLGKEGQLKSNPMSNLDFISYPLGEYILNNIEFGKNLKNVPKIFSTNYFLRDRQGNFCTGKLAKKVWLHWFEGRINNEFEVYKTPTGFIPKYEDLRDMFKKFFDEDYEEENYKYQFSFRCNNWIAKLERSIKFLNRMDPNAPGLIVEKWQNAIETIRAAKEKYGAIILPGVYC